MFCGLNYDEFNKTSCFVGSIMTNLINCHKVLGLGSIPSNSSQIVCNCDAPLKCHRIFVIDHHISCSEQILYSYMLTEISVGGYMNLGYLTSRTQATINKTALSPTTYNIQNVSTSNSSLLVSQTQARVSHIG